MSALQQRVDTSGLGEFKPLLYGATEMAAGSRSPIAPEMYCVCTELMIVLGAAGASLASLLAMLCSSMHASSRDLMASPECVQLKVGCLCISLTPRKMIWHQASVYLSGHMPCICASPLQ